MTWTEDRCTCGCPVTRHVDGVGKCLPCGDKAKWGSSADRAQACQRYQWNGEPRRRTW